MVTQFQLDAGRLVVDGLQRHLQEQGIVDAHCRQALFFSHSDAEGEVARTEIQEDGESGGDAEISLSATTYLNAHFLKTIHHTYKGFAPHTTLNKVNFCKFRC